MKRTPSDQAQQASGFQVAARLDKLIVHDYAYHDIPGTVWDAWEVCNAQWHSYPWESVTWLRAAAERLCPDITSHLLVASDPRSGPVAFWPYRMQRTGSTGVLSFILCRPWDENPWATASIIASPALGNEDCRLIAEAFLAKLSKWDKMMLAMLHKPSPMLDAVVEAFEQAGIRFQRTDHVCLEIRGWKSFSEFLGSLSKNWRKQYNRLTKRYQQAGTVRLERLDGEQTLENLESIKRRILDIYRESWKADSAKRHSSLMLPETYAHFSALLDAFAKKQWLHVTFVTIDGDDAVFRVGLQCENVYCSLQSAYKEKYTKMSVGFLATFEDFRYLIEQGFLKNNLMGHHGHFKHYTDAQQRFSVLLAFNRSTRGTIALFLYKAKTVLKRLALSLRNNLSRKQSRSNN